jgi:hypothetical protein
MATEGSVLQKPASDPNVVIPPAVKRAAQRSEDLAAQAKTLRETRAPNADDPVRIANPPSSAPNAASGVVTAPFNPNNPTPPDPTINSQPANSTPSADWEHQFNSMKGRYERTEADNRRMAAQITDMQRLLSTLPTTQSPSPRVPEGSGVQFTGGVSGNAPRAPQRRLSQKEIEEYTPELLDVVGRRAQEVLEPALQGIYNQFESRIGQLQNQLGGVRGAIVYNAQEKMYQDLGKAVPNWEQINTMPEWHAWLRSPDPMTGLVRQNILTSAHQNSQTAQVVGVFERFMAEHNMRSYAPAEPSSSQVDLMSLAAPGRAKEGQSSVPQTKPSYTGADIKQFFTDKTFGRYAGREAEAEAIETDILLAGKEGRIRN